MTAKSSAKVLILDAEKNALVLRRSETHPHIPFTADLPGGEIEPGESAEQAAIREVFEETNVRLKEVSLKNVSERQFDAYGNHYELHLFEAQLHSRPDVTISWEHDKYIWVPIQEIGGFDEGYEVLVNDYKRGHIGK